MKKSRDMHGDLYTEETRAVSARSHAASVGVRLAAATVLCWILEALAVRRSRRSF